MTDGGLKEAVRKIILEDVFRPLHLKGEWKVLVVDELGKKLCSSCLKMNDMMDNGITIIEDLKKARQPLLYLEALYLVRPSKDNIDRIKKDFSQDDSSSRLYKTGHLFFTDIISDDFLIDIAKSMMAPYVKTVKEVNIAFLPIEGRVFCLDNPNAYKMWYGNEKDGEEADRRMEEIAEQLVTVCATLDEYPRVRICKSNLKCVETLAQKVQSKLEIYKEEGIITPNSAGRSQLIILDRGFDMISPFLHELTLQAMAYDLLAPDKIDPEKNTYKFDSGSGSFDECKKEVILDPSNELWVTLRHQHISDVVKNVQKLKSDLTIKYQDLVGGQGNKNMTDMKNIIKKMPKYKKEMANHATFFTLAEDCMNAYGKVENVVKLEQDMATGTDALGRPIGDHMKSCVTVFVPPDNGPMYSPYQKLRILILYVLNRKGINRTLTKEHLTRLILKAGIQSEEKTIHNLSSLGLDVFNTPNFVPRKFPPRRERPEVGLYETSRWTPVVKDIMESLVLDRALDANHYPFFNNDERGANDVEAGGVTSVRGYGKKQGGVITGKTTGPKLIIYVMGSISYSEMRCSHEVSSTQTRSGWEVVIGSDMILTPEHYLRELMHLNSPES